MFDDKKIIHFLKSILTLKNIAKHFDGPSIFKG